MRGLCPRPAEQVRPVDRLAECIGCLRRGQPAFAGVNGPSDGSTGPGLSAWPSGRLAARNITPMITGLPSEGQGGAGEGIFQVRNRWAGDVEREVQRLELTFRPQLRGSTAIGPLNHGGNRSERIGAEAGLLIWPIARQLGRAEATERLRFRRDRPVRPIRPRGAHVARISASSYICDDRRCTAS